MAILIFPSSIEASLHFLKDAKTWNHKEKVIGASSIDDDPYSGLFDSWEKLPFIHEHSFSVNLSEVISRNEITSIFTPHAPSYLRLIEIKNQLPKNVTIIGDGPFNIQMNSIRELNSKTALNLKKINKLIGFSSSVGESLVASILNRSSSIYGECSEEKIIALCSIFSNCPKGDVIEIGTFFGKSAFVLNRLASHFNIGTTLAIDPWDSFTSIQKDSPSTIQNLSSVWDWELVFQGFLLNLQSSYSPHFNYIRASSQDAWGLYKSSNIISSKEFGNTPTTHKIAILHIDGNHDEKEISKDFKIWSQYLVDGAWIIFDDYNWSQGVGPKNIVEQINKDWKNKIICQFVAGGAAFLKIGN